MRAELALQAEPLIAAKAKERQELGINQYSLAANLPEAEKGETRDELATMANVSARNISKVKHIIETGSPNNHETVSGLLFAGRYCGVG